MNNKSNDYQYRKIDQKIRNLKINRVETLTHIGGYILSGSLVGSVLMENSTEAISTVFIIDLLFLGVSGIKYCKYSKEIDNLEYRKKKIKQKKYYTLKRISNF